MEEVEQLTRPDFIQIGEEEIPFYIYEKHLMDFIDRWIFSKAKAKGISMREYLYTYQEELSERVLNEYHNS
jgi:retron-type reverse transcriptase